MTIQMRFRTTRRVAYGDVLVPPRGKPLRVEHVRKTRPDEFGSWCIWADYIPRSVVAKSPPERRHDIRRLTTSFRWVEER